METRIFAVMDGTRKINAGNHWEITDNFAFTGDRQGVFIVKARPLDINENISCGEIVSFQSLNIGNGFAINLFKH